MAEMSMQNTSLIRAKPIRNPNWSANYFCSNSVSTATKGASRILKISVGGNPCYLCVEDNVKGQNYNAQCNSVPNRSAVNTYDAAGTCAARPSEQNNGSMVAGTLGCSTGCEIAVANDGSVKPTGGVCTVPSLKIEPAKNNCCDVGDSVTAG
jgi:hypothetical protein